MWTKQHAIISALATPLMAAIVYGSLLEEINAFMLLLIFPIGIAAGTLVDLDHFLIARYRTGNWKALSKVVENPIYYLKNQSKIFSSQSVKRTDRSTTHFVQLVFANMISVVLGTGYWSASFSFIGWIILIHMISDFYSDVRGEEI